MYSRINAKHAAKTASSELSLGTLPKGFRRRWIPSKLLTYALAGGSVLGPLAGAALLERRGGSVAKETESQFRCENHTLLSHGKISPQKEASLDALLDKQTSEIVKNTPKLKGLIIEKGPWCKRFGSLIDIALSPLSGTLKPEERSALEKGVAELLVQSESLKASAQRTEKLVSTGKLEGDAAKCALRILNLGREGPGKEDALYVDVVFFRVSRYAADESLAHYSASLLAKGSAEFFKLLKEDREAFAELRKVKTAFNWLESNETKSQGLQQELERLERELSALREKAKVQAEKLEAQNAELQKQLRAREEVEKAREQRRKIDLIPTREAGYELVTLASYGGKRGAEFSDVIPEGARIVGIGLRQGEHVDAIWLMYEHGGHVLETPHRGGRGGTEVKHFLDRDEYITDFGVDGRKTVDQLLIFTNKRRIVGGDGKTPICGLDKATEGQARKNDFPGHIVAVGIVGRADSELRAAKLVVQYKEAR